MDNKKWYNRFATVFWWSLTIAPILFIVANLIGCILNFNSLGGTFATGSELTTIFNDTIEGSLANISIFDNYVPSFVSTSIANFFNSLFGSSSTYSEVCAIVFAWGIWIQLIHLFFDIVVWLPHFCHNLLERWC